MSFRCPVAVVHAVWEGALVVSVAASDHSRHFRRPDPALLRTHDPHLAGDLLQDGAQRRPRRLPGSDHPFPRIGSRTTLPLMTPTRVSGLLPVLPGLGRVPTHHPGYVHRTGGLSHTQQDNGPPSLGPRRHANFAGYTRDHSGRYPCRSKHRSLLSGVVTSG